MKQKILYAIIFIIAFGVGIFLGILFVKHNFGFWKSMFILAFIMIGISLSVFLHEFGHFIFGKLTGYKLVSFSISPIKLAKENGKWKIKKFNIPGAGGQCIMSPPEPINNKIPYKLYLSGGFIVNIICFLICIPLFFYVDTWLKFIVVIFAVINFLSTLTNVIPNSDNSIIKNDAGTIKEIGKIENGSFALYLQLKTHELIANGCKVEDLDDKFTQLPNENELKNFMFTSITGTNVSKYLYQQDFSKAIEIIEYLLNNNFRYVQITKILLETELGFLRLMTDNTENLNEIFTKENLNILQSLKTEISAQRILYAYYLLNERNFVKAEKIKSNINKYSSHILAGIKDDEFELIELVENKANVL